jgi:hypothetical protein
MMISKKRPILLGICIAWYLAFATEVHFLSSPDAPPGFVPDSSMAPAASAAAPTSPFRVDELPPLDSRGQVSVQGQVAQRIDGE